MGDSGPELNQNEANSPDPNGDVVLIVSKASSETSSSKEAEPPTRFRVSSKHLILASKYFAASLKSGWAEGNDLRENGLVEMEIPDTDPEAMLILLNIFHCRTPQVPKYVSLSLLTKLAVLTDYFQCHDALGLYPERWMQQLKSTCPTNYVTDVTRTRGKHNYDIINWILISWVFRDPDIFKSVTRLAQRQGRGKIDLLSLPIPATIRDAIDESRITALSKVLGVVENRVHELKGEDVCSFGCDALMLGSLMKHMKAKDIPRYRSSLEYEGYSIQDIVSKLSKLEAPKCTSDHHCRCGGLAFLDIVCLLRLNKANNLQLGWIWQNFSRWWTGRLKWGFEKLFDGITFYIFDFSLLISW